MQGFVNWMGTEYPPRGRFSHTRSVNHRHCKKSSKRFKWNVLFQVSALADAAFTLYGWAVG